MQTFLFSSLNILVYLNPELYKNIWKYLGTYTSSKINF